MSDFLIYSPSYKRVKNVTSHKLIEDDKFYYCVHEFEYEEYKRNYKNVISIPDNIKGNIARVRNYILKNKKSKYVLMIDDDLKAINLLKNKKNVKLSKIEISQLIENMIIMGEDFNVGLVGINSQDDPKFYKQNSPFSFNLHILGTFSLILDTNILYDENIPLKEDYDYFLQNMQKYKNVLRLNAFNYNCDHLKLKGGCQEYINEKFENENFEYLQKKWGSSIVKENHKEGSYNPRIHL